MATKDAVGSKTDQENVPFSPWAKLDLAITIVLYSWPALTLAVQSSWGGTDSKGKREWLCGAIAELFTSRPETDAGDIEEILIQVMSDEFDVVVDDESVSQVADRIYQLKVDIENGNFRQVDAMWATWQEKEQSGALDLPNSMFSKVETNEEDQETDNDEDEDEEDDDDDKDVDMADARAFNRPPRQRQEPEVDDDGFTKVAGRRKR
ncbi:hypothetical protein FQN57_000504 [Myotisia sp. PD_48]|nr:hypothetical protein FQN57_000504 [Myotisia sp. PD_48]